jgi:FKBP-type peptidyl-prolyl cis-trans isomerase FkpA
MRVLSVSVYAFRFTAPSRGDYMSRISTAALLLGTFCTAATAQPALETDEQKTLYALGVALGQNIRDFDLTAAELDIVAVGVSDAALGSALKVDMAAFAPRVRALAAEREKAASADYLYEMAQSPGAQRSASGIVYIPIVEGTGRSPTATDTVNVHYHGTFRTGAVFDSSIERGEPVSFPLDGVIPCWTEGLQKMKVGGKAKLVCPAETAYGEAGQGPIPGGAALTFEVELLGIGEPAGREAE